MQILKKIKKIFNEKIYTDVENQLRDELIENFIRLLNIEKMELEGFDKEGISVGYLAANFKAMNVLNAFYGTVSGMLAYSMANKLAGGDEDITPKEVVKFFIELQHEEIFSKTCAAMDALRDYSLTYPGEKGRKFWDFFVSPGEIKKIFNDSLNKKKLA